VAVYSVDKLIAETRRLAAEYRRTTGTSLPVTAEIVRHDAARLLDLELLPPDTPLGYDAVGRGRWQGKRVQIKGRAIFDEGKGGQRIGQIKGGGDWDSVVLVLLDEEFEPYEIHEAVRADIEDALSEAEGSKRSRRGALSVAKFRIIARLVWTREHGLEDDDLWDNQAHL
jgi:hypothetical protein